MTATNNELKTILGNTVTMYFRLQIYHWNVNGPLFLNLHNMFQDMYEEILPSIDEIAEAIKINGEQAPFSINEIISNVTVQPEVEIPKTSVDMLSNLSQGFDELIESLKKGIEVAENEKVCDVEDLLRSRMSAIKKHNWFIKSHLG